MRLERAKLHGRWFFESLDSSLKELPIDVNEIVNSNPNWKLLFADLYGEDGYTLFKYKNGKKKFQICIEPYGMVERKRFTLAHEIGHIVLGHFEQYYSRELTPYEEFVSDKEADMVAGEILMPYSYMLEHYKWSIKGLTYRYHVSKEAARVRLDILKNDSMFLRDINKNNNSNILFDDIYAIINHFY
ncbi:ImmA/IrrE family metallo-endopeptidase [Tissierella praeacuta]|uniref:ImmA/IrrE family metallo-endopeptidase n=1 Tax=Tissierella praeacuta TaxID=43131 RepID=UPI003DA3C0E5